jgi:adenylate cyclase
MVFAEADRSSPKRVLKELNITSAVAKDYDEILAKTLANSPAILGMVFNFEKNIPTNQPPRQNAIFKEKNKQNFNDYIPKALGYTTNLSILSQNSYSSGSFNVFSDSDGVVRYVPMLFSYDGTIYPSLSLEMVRVMLGVKIVEIYYDENGVVGLKLGDLEIPTDRYGRVFVNYRGDRSYRYISAVDVYENRVDKKELEGKILLFGTSASGLLDLRSTPFSSVFPGVEIHANVLDNIINSEFISSPSYLLGQNIVVIFVAVFILTFILRFLSPFLSLVFSFVYISTLFYYLYHEMFFNGTLLNFLYPILAVVATVFYMLFNKLFIESKQKELIKKKFATKVSPAVVEELLKNDVDFSAKEKEITIFFSDIRNFTTISEEFGSAKKLLEYLNSYLSKMSEIVISSQGTIDKYIGDAVMAYWNAPISQDSHSDLALKCAIKQLESLEELNKTLTPPISIGIGIHTGVATVGEIGSQSRSDFTIIGDSVNLCSRLEGLTKAYGAKIIISEDTKQKLKNSYKIRELDLVQVKGKNRSIKIYEVLGFDKFNNNEKIRENLYKKALKFYKNADFVEAKVLFEELHEKYGLFLYEIYIKRCQELIKQNIKQFDGVYRFVTK